MNFDENGKVITNTTVVYDLIENRENIIRNDLRKISNYFKISEPKLIIRINRVKSSFSPFKYRIILGIRGGYRRTSLIHEMIHATGKRHCDGYRSHSNNDHLSPAIERKIFGE